MVSTGDSTPTIILPIFGGQGVLSFDPEGASKRLALYTSVPSGAVLYDACYDALHTELRSLPSDLAENVGICASDFKEKTSILSPIHEQYLLNPVISGTALLLQQALQYLFFVEKLDSETRDDCSLGNKFYLNFQNKVGIPGFSSGILAAAVVATSRTKLDFIKHAVEAYRLAFWTGVRVQLYQLGTQPHQNSDPWALVIFSNKLDVEQSVLVFNKGSAPRVYITAVIDDNCVTVSGQPDDLASFRHFLPDTAVVCETSIAGLYHVPSLLDTVREEVLSDVESRDIQFPTFQNLFAPLRCSNTGEILHSSTESLITSVVDMILIHPVHWHKVVKGISASIPLDYPVQILNFGGGKGLVRSLTESFKQHGISNFQCLDMGGDGMVRSSTRHEPIAIVGMAVNMPGAKGVDELWDILKNGSKTLQPIPSDRFVFSTYTSGEIPGRSMNVDTGNFIRDVGGFDNKFFGINPREAKSMDPQQRILLHVAYEALEDAGYVPESTPTFSRDTFGCYIGAATHDYVHNLRQSIDVYYATGTLGAFLSGRLSYCLGLSGPSMVIDTACSSSIVAIHQACRALSNGDCNAALAGGVNVISSPDMFIGLDRAHFLSSTGCKSFDALADGYSRADGCGIFVLKRLSDAVAENDRILGLIRGIEVNQSGMAHSITHPHGPTQESLLRRVLERSDVDPRLINFVESHGTGTQAGDVNEIQSLRRILAVDRSSGNPLYIGGIKANIGHLEAASGSASLAKVLLMMRHKMIPSQVSLNHLNPKIPCLDLDNTVISTENIPWLPAPEGKRRFALINNFGAAGSNAAMIIEEHVPTSTRPDLSDVSSYVFALSAKDNEALENSRANLFRWLQGNKETCLADLSYTLLARKQDYPNRLVVTAATTEELVSRLGQAIPVHTYHQETPVIFAFSGRGSLYRGMGSALYLSCSLFRKRIDECDSILRAAKLDSILPVIMGVAINDDKTDFCTEEVYQTAIFSLEYALAMLWISWGIKPTAVVGHSLGEYAALVVAGVFSLSDALNLVAKRSRLVFEKCARHSTGMLAVALEPAKLRSILESSWGSNLAISCYNSPQACVISGPIGELATLKNFLESVFACQCTQLDVPFAYHSPAMAPILGDLAAIGRRVKARPPSIPVISGVFGRVVMPGDGSFCNSDYVAKHCAYPVRFVDSIESYLSCHLYTPETTWIEIGPHASLLPMLKSFPPLSKSNIISSLHKRHDNWTALSKALASLCLTHSINWRVIFSQIGRPRVLSLPTYPFSPKTYWTTYREHAVTSAREFSVIQNWEQRPSSSNMGVAIFEASISHLTPYMDGHRVGGVPLCPASVFIELVAASTTLALKYLSRYPLDSTLVFTDFTFTKPITTNSKRNKSASSLRISVDTMDGVFSINSCGRSSESLDEIIHAEGQCKLLGKAETFCELEELLPTIDMRIKDIIGVPSDDRGPEKFSTRTIYDNLFARVVGYSKEFQTIQSLVLSSDGLEAIANIRIDVGFQFDTFVVNILLSDTLIHVPGLVANLQGSQAHAYICSKIGSLTVLPGYVDRSYRFTVYCKISELSDGMLCQSYAFREGQPRVLVATAREIQFQRVNLAGLKFSLGNPADPPTESPSLPDKRILGNTASTIVDIVSQACDLDAKDVSFEVDFDTFGIDSLGRSELYHGITSAFPNVHIHLDDISNCTNIQAIIEFISSRSITTTVPCLKNQPTSFSPSNSADIKQIFAQVLDMDEDFIDEDTDLGSLGFDSLSCLEVVHLLATRCDVHLLPSFINWNSTIRDVRNHILSSEVLRDNGINNISESARKILPGALDYQKQLLSLQKAVSSPRSPLILIHDGSGLAGCYRHISNIHRDLYGINNPYFLTPQFWSSITELATTYADYIQKEIDRPVLVGGWSFGGVVAFEVARILRARSLTVKGVILIDSSSPFLRAELNTDVIDYVLGNTKSVDASPRELCKSQFSMNSRLLSEYKPSLPEERQVIPVVFLRSMDGFNSLNLTDVPAWLANRTDAKSTVSGWDALSGSPIHTIDIPGNHFQPFESENVEAVSLAISQACVILDK